MARHASGFTLVELIVGVSIFVLVFLAGFGGLARLMMIQDRNYASSVAASAAMFLAKWHADTSIAADPATMKTLTGSEGTWFDSDGPANDKPLMKLAALAAYTRGSPANVKFRGNDFTDAKWRLPITLHGTMPYAAATDTEFFVFNMGPGKVKPPSGNPTGRTIDLPVEYNTLLIAISPATTESESQGNVVFRQITFWSGPEALINHLRSPSYGGGKTIAVDLVGRYVITEGCSR